MTLGLQHLQLLNVAMGSGPPSGMHSSLYHRTNYLLVEQHIVSDRQVTSPVKEGAKQTQVAFLSTNLTCADEISHVSRVTPRQLALSTHRIGSPKNLTRLRL
jgi:hypothetical protein